MKVSVIISNRNDVSMLVVTIRSILEELRPLNDDSDIIIVDNSDLDDYKLLNDEFPRGYLETGKIKFFRQDFPCIFTARETAIKQSKATYIVCVDSHMLVGRNMILDLVTFMDTHKDDETLGFAHAPINWLHQSESKSRHDRDMSECELGNWGLKHNKVQTITWKGMPWICKREWFLSREDGIGGYGALSQHHLAWGGGDMHIGIKPWLLGYKNWAVPTSPAIHIGPFPNEIGDNPNYIRTHKYEARDKYRLYQLSGKGSVSLGFLVSCYILGGEPMMQRNAKALTRRFSKVLDVKKSWDAAIAYGKDEKRWLDSEKVITFEELLTLKPWDSN